MINDYTCPQRLSLKLIDEMDLIVLIHLIFHLTSDLVQLHMQHNDFNGTPLISGSRIFLLPPHLTMYYNFKLSLETTMNIWVYNLGVRDVMHFWNTLYHLRANLKDWKIRKYT